MPKIRDVDILWRCAANQRVSDRNLHPWVMVIMCSVVVGFGVV
jgi:hypothetical protein